MADAPISPETVWEKLRQIREDAIDLLRQTGFVFKLQSGSPVIEVIADSIELRHLDDKTTIIIDGKDVTELTQSVNVSIRPGAYPVFGVNLAPRGFKINTPDEQLGIRLRSQVPPKSCE